MVKDMTTGEPQKVLWSFSIPLLLSVVFQQLYSIVDSVIAGRFVGVDALAAVGASYPVTMIYIAMRRAPISALLSLFPSILGRRITPT